MARKTEHMSTMPGIQYRFTGTALAAFLIFLAAVATTGFAWYRAAATETQTAQSKSAAQKANAEHVKRLLGNAMATGQTLLQELPLKDWEKDWEQAEKDVTNWDEKTRDLIEAAYGSGEAQLLINRRRLIYDIGTVQTILRNVIETRLQQLAELLPRIDALTVRDGFNPDQFQN